MNIIPINASLKYDVMIESGLLARSGELIRKVVKKGRAAVITDSTVDALYAETVMASLADAGCDPMKYVFPAGEASKNIMTLSGILEHLAEHRLTRADFIVALGGGVTGDMAGFAASCYLRGIPFVQLPTTFLAAVDSSVGGKTAVDLHAGKNLCGAFHQPSLVLCDTKTLDTLIPEIFADGAAEALKAGILRDESLFAKMEQGSYKADIDSVIGRCVEIKAQLVEEDERDTGARQLLNLGHTMGHAAEKISDFSLTHGHAVAMGMAAITRAAEKLGVCEPCYERVCAALTANDLPTRCPYSAEELANAALSDKKRSGGRINLVLPKKIGECFLYPVDVTEVERIFALGLEE